MNRGYKKSEETRKKLSESHKGKKHSEEVRKRIGTSLKGNKNALGHKGHLGCKHSEEAKRRISDTMAGRMGDKSGNWKGGYNSNNIPKFDVYAHQISYAEEVKRNIKDQNILEVKCVYCGKYFVPTLSAIRARITALNSTTRGEHRLYCSDYCKLECPIYRRQKYSAEETYSNIHAREVHPQLRQMVFERDNWTCQKCGSTESLHCHHLEGIRWEPLESADIDKCITHCKSCHFEDHKLPGCGYQDMKCMSDIS